MERGRFSILAVDDTPENLRLMIDGLHACGYVMRVAPNGAMALRSAKRSPPDLILLDINMPEMDGIEVCRHLKAHPRTKDIPVIFLSALDDGYDKVRAFVTGGVDYITKPFHFEEVEARVRTQLSLRSMHLELQASYEKLQHLEHLRDELVHMVVHDMRSPLSAIALSLDLAQQALEGKTDAETLEDINKAVIGGRRLVQMTQDLLDISRLEAGRMPVDVSPCALPEVVQRVFDSARKMDRQRTMQLTAPEELWVNCDAAIVERILENLLENALKHTPASGGLRVDVEAQAGGARVTVRDSGAGVPVEFREAIFEKFGTLQARSERKYHSVGLGLAFCKLAVQAHNGQIGVDDNDGGGSAFWFTLPASPA